MPRASNGRNAAIATAADLFRRHGYAATGLETIIATSGAPKGSFYHYFPGGKEELAVESVRFSGDRVRDLVATLSAQFSSPGELVRSIAAQQAKDLRESGYERGCPVATVALELAGTSDAIAKVSAAAFEQWVEVLSDKIESGGVPAPESLLLARWALAGLEGALLLARTSRDDSIVTDLAAITARLLDERATL